MSLLQLKKTVGTVELVKKVRRVQQEVIPTSLRLLFSTLPPFPPSFFYLFTLVRWNFFLASRYHFSWSNYVIIVFKVHETRTCLILMVVSASWRLINKLQWVYWYCVENLIYEQTRCYAVGICAIVTFTSMNKDE